MPKKGTYFFVTTILRTYISQHLTDPNPKYSQNKINFLIHLISDNTNSSQGSKTKILVRTHNKHSPKPWWASEGNVDVVHGNNLKGKFWFKCQEKTSTNNFTLIISIVVNILQHAIYILQYDMINKKIKTYLICDTGYISYDMASVSYDIYILRYVIC